MTALAAHSFVWRWESRLTSVCFFTIAFFRQAIWRRRGEVDGEPIVTDTVPSMTEATDICRWVNADSMLADALKREKQRQRSADKNQKKEKKELQVQSQLEGARVEVMENCHLKHCSVYDDAILKKKKKTALGRARRIVVVHGYVVWALRDFFQTFVRGLADKNHECGHQLFSVRSSARSFHHVEHRASSTCLHLL